MNIDTNKDKPPPLVLVKTWVHFAKTSNEPEAQHRAIEMLKQKIGTPEQIIRYLRKHNIS